MAGIFVAGGVLAVLAIQAWVLIHARAQQQRLWVRLDSLFDLLADRSAPAPQPTDRFNAAAGKPAPDFSLTELGGDRLTLAELLAPAKPLLLVFVDPRCGPCYELLPDIAGWQRVYGDQLTIALITSGDPATNHAMTAEYGIRPVLIQQELELVTAYELAQAPAAVVIQPDGRISAGPRYGVHPIRQLMADTLGLVLPPPPAHETPGVSVGDPAPALRRPDLDGNPVDLAALQGAPLLVLFWSPGCEHCRALLPEALAFERQTRRPRIVVVSRGPIGLNRDLGFSSPIVLDDDRVIAGTFGVAGTPAAVLVDRGGNVASPIARGTAGVRALLAEIDRAAAVTTQAAG